MLSVRASTAGTKFMPAGPARFGLWEVLRMPGTGVIAVSTLLVAVALGALLACSAESAFILKPAGGPEEGLVSRWAFDEGD